MDMTKFEYEDDPGFIAIAEELRRWSKDLALLKISRNLPMQQDHLGEHRYDRVMKQIYERESQQCKSVFKCLAARRWI